MRTGRSLVTALLAVAVSFGAGAPSVAAPNLDGAETAQGRHAELTASEAVVTYGASAWGSTVSVAGPLVNAGKTSNVVVSCTQQAGVTKTNDSAAVDIPGVAHVGAVATSAKTRKSSTGQWSISQSTVAGAELLDGQIEVGAIDAKAAVRRNPDGSYAPSTVFSVAELKILGETVKVGKGRQVIKVDGLAEIILNDSTRKSFPLSGSASGTAITVKVLETGAVVRLGEVRATLNGRPATAAMSGNAFGTRLTVGGVVKSGPTALQALPCLGTNGAERSNNVAGVDVAGIASVQGIESTVVGQQTPKASASAQNTIADVELLGGLGTISGISTSVEAWRNPDGSLGYEPVAEIGSIKVAGIELDVPSTPGARLTLPGIGSLRFMDVKEINSGNGVQVVGVRLDLLGGQILELSRATVTLRPMK